MNDNKIETKLLNSEIAQHLKSKGYEHIDTDFDDGECRIVFQDPKEEEITITIMWQEE